MTGRRTCGISGNQFVKYRDFRNSLNPQNIEERMGDAGVICGRPFFNKARHQTEGAGRLGEGYHEGPA